MLPGQEQLGQTKEVRVMGDSKSSISPCCLRPLARHSFLSLLST